MGHTIQIIPQPFKYQTYIYRNPNMVITVSADVLPPVLAAIEDFDLLLADWTQFLKMASKVPPNLETILVWNLNFKDKL